MRIKATILICLCVTVQASHALTPPKPVKDMTPEERTQWAKVCETNFYARTGGVIVKPNSKTGNIVFINKQNILPDEQIEKVIEILRKDNNVTYTLLKARPSDHTIDLIAKAQATFAIVVVHDQSKPSMLVAPDEGWSELNVARFKFGIPTGSLQHIPYFARCRKGLLRAVAALIGFRSQFPNNILAVNKIEDLDSVEEFIPGDIQMLMKQNFKAHNVSPEIKMTYIRACKEGWAPRPTNEVQKAIWEKVHAPPEKPLKIEFDPATQKGKVTK